jgi:hypothetical protein
MWSLDCHKQRRDSALGRPILYLSGRPTKNCMGCLTLTFIAICIGINWSPVQLPASIRSVVPSSGDTISYFVIPSSNSGFFFSFALFEYANTFSYNTCIDIESERMFFYKHAWKITVSSLPGLQLMPVGRNWERTVHYFFQISMLPFNTYEYNYYDNQ